MEQFFDPTKSNQGKYDEYVRGHEKKKKKKRQDWKSFHEHTFFKIIVMPKIYGMLWHRATIVQDMFKMIMVYKSNADRSTRYF